jgi:hypothetical protein
MKLLGPVTIVTSKLEGDDENYRTDTYDEDRKATRQEDYEVVLQEFRQPQ